MSESRSWFEPISKQRHTTTILDMIYNRHKLGLYSGTIPFTSEIFESSESSSDVDENKQSQFKYSNNIEYGNSYDFRHTPNHVNIDVSNVNNSEVDDSNSSIKELINENPLQPISDLINNISDTESADLDNDLSNSSIQELINDNPLQQITDLINNISDTESADYYNNDDIAAVLPDYLQDESSIEDSVGAFSIDSNDTDQLCTFWPYNLITNHWNGIKYDIDLGSPETVLRCLKYWCQGCGLYDWLSRRDYMEKPIPNIFSAKAAHEMQIDLTALDQIDSKLITDVYTKIVMKDNDFLYMLNSDIHKQWINIIQTQGAKSPPKDVLHQMNSKSHLLNHHENTNANNNENNNENTNENNNENNNENSQVQFDMPDMKIWEANVDEINQEKWTSTNHVHKYNKKGSSKLKPLTDIYNPWYPGECEMWMDEFFRMVIGIDKFEQIETFIQRFTPKKQITFVDSNYSWIPKNPWYLFNLYQPFASVYKIRLVRCKILTQVSKNVSDYVERVYAYDSFINDITLFLQNHLHRSALLGSPKDFLKFHKHNPIHKDNTTKKYFHSSQWKISKFGFWKFLEKVFFIIDSTQCNDKYWDTKLVTIGTFVEINKPEGKHNDFGIVCDIINYKWTFNMTREDGEDLITWHTRLGEYIQRFATEPDTIENEFLYPKYEIDYLQLIWKYQECPFPEDHDHSHPHIDVHYRQLWLNCTNLQNHCTNLIKHTTVNDNLRIWSLSVDGILLFPEPDSYANDQTPLAESVWEWNMIIDDKQAMSPFGNQILVKFLQCLKDPYDLIWVGRRDYRDPQNTMFVIPFQQNSDAFEYIKSSNSYRGKQSTKENFVCPMNHCLSANLISSFGIVLSGSNNIPFYTMFAKDVLKSIFFGHDITIENGTRVIKVFMYICSLLNDGDEVRNVTGRVGAAGNRPDYFNVLNKMMGNDMFTKHPFRYYKIMITQAV